MLDIFDYSSPIKLFERLKRQYEKLEEADSDPDLALDFCQTAWSLADWVFYDRYPRGTNSEKGNFRTTVFIPGM